jgi:hypothetical protein
MTALIPAICVLVLGGFWVFMLYTTKRERWDRLVRDMSRQMFEQAHRMKVAEEELERTPVLTQEILDKIMRIEVIGNHQKDLIQIRTAVWEVPGIELHYIRDKGPMIQHLTRALVRELIPNG